MQAGQERGNTAERAPDSTAVKKYQEPKKRVTDATALSVVGSDAWGVLVCDCQSQNGLRDFHESSGYTVTLDFTYTSVKKTPV